MSTPPNMATITAALERSLQKCSLTHIHHHAVSSSDSHSGVGGGVGGGGGGGGVLANSSSNGQQNQNQNHHLLQPYPTLDLNSHISLPYHWEQCLDLKTGEIYYINWRNGMKAKEDPRSTITEDHQYNEDYYYYYSDNDDDSSSYDSEESSNININININNNKEHEEEEEGEGGKEDHVLVVAGCKSCLMYFMVPKHLEDCPKCSTGQLLHFDRSENDIP